MKELYGPARWWDCVRGRAPETVPFHRYYREAAEPGQRRRAVVPVVEPCAYDDYDIQLVEPAWRRLLRALRQWALAPQTV